MKIAFLLIIIIFITGCKNNMIAPKISLPEYVALNVETLNSSQNKTIRLKTTKLSFPLSLEDLRDINILEQKYDQEENCAGLAAPANRNLKTDYSVCSSQ